MVPSFPVISCHKETLAVSSAIQNRWQPTTMQGIPHLLNRTTFGSPRRHNTNNCHTVYIDT
jgi:hypothetical protein